MCWFAVDRELSKYVLNLHIARTGSDGLAWDNREGTVRALNLAATVLTQL